MRFIIIITWAIMWLRRDLSHFNSNGYEKGRTCLAVENKARNRFGVLDTSVLGQCLYTTQISSNLRILHLSGHFLTHGAARGRLRTSSATTPRVDTVLLYVFRNNYILGGGGGLIL